MKAAFGTITCAVALIAAVPYAANAAPAQATTTTTADTADRALDKKIAQQLKSDPSLKHYDVKVSVDKGVATLTGSVATDVERKRAAELAKTSGAVRVDNQLIVDVNAGTKGTAGTLERKAKEGAEATKEQTEKAASKTKDAAKSAGAEVTDGWISTTIKTQFMGDEGTRGSNIHVDTDHHVVTLTGTVVSAAARAKAVQLAKDTDGVARVIDKLKVAK